MRRIIPVIVFALITILFYTCKKDEIATGQFFDIQEPNISSIWYPNESYTVKWLGTGEGNVHIYLYLLNPDFPVAVDSAMNQPNSGEITFSLSGALSAGNAYSIAIINAEDDSQFEYSDRFRVESANTGVVYQMKVNAPTENDIFVNGDKPEISWESNVSSNIRIDLYKSDAIVMNIVESATNNGSFSGWTVPDILESGSDYQIKLSAEGGAVTAFSDYFGLQIQTNIQINSPTGATEWQLGAQGYISWESNSKSKLKIEYVAAGSANTLESSAEPTGNLIWKIPATLSAGDNYQIRISEVDNSSNSSISDYFTLIPAQSGNTWQTITGFSASGREAAVAFSVGDKGYYGLGRSGSQQFSDIWEYNPQTDTWSQVASYEGAGRSGAVALSFGNKAVVGSGASSTQFFSDFYAYYPDKNIWERIADFPGTPRTEASAANSEDVGFVVGGRSADGPQTGIYKFDNYTNNWSFVTHLPAPRYSGAAGYVDQKLIFVGGADINNQYADCYVYSLSSNSWKNVENFPDGTISNAATFSSGSNVYIATGLVNNQTSSGLWVFNTISETWASNTSFPGESRQSSVCFTLGDYAYVGGGYAGTVKYNNFWKYKP